MPVFNRESTPQGMQVIKDMRVDGLSIYWCPAKPLANSDPDSPIAAWLGSIDNPSMEGPSMHASGLPPDMHDILPGLSFDLRLTTKYGESASCLTTCNNLAGVRWH